MNRISKVISLTGVVMMLSGCQSEPTHETKGSVSVDPSFSVRESQTESLEPKTYVPTKHDGLLTLDEEPDFKFCKARPEDVADNEEDAKYWNPHAKVGFTISDSATTDYSQTIATSDENVIPQSAISMEPVYYKTSNVIPDFATCQTRKSQKTPK